MADAGVAPLLSEIHTAWLRRIDEILAEATLTRPNDRAHSWHGKRGQHSEHLGYILAEMQHLQRTYPEARWYTSLAPHTAHGPLPHPRMRPWIGDCRWHGRPS